MLREKQDSGLPVKLCSWPRGQQQGSAFTSAFHSGLVFICEVLACVGARGELCPGLNAWGGLLGMRGS